MEPKKCTECNSSQVYFRKDKSMYCRRCGFDSRKDKEEK
jgi:hypothetical protein